MPFITEEIFTHLPGEEESIVISPWPKFNEDLIFKDEEEEIQLIMELIRGIRNARAEMNVVPSRKAKAIFIVRNKNIEKVIGKSEVYFQKLASVSEIVVNSQKIDIPDNALSIVAEGVEVFIPLEDLIDKEKEIERLEKEKEVLEMELKRVNGKLSNKGFIQKAPTKIVEEEKEKKIKYEEMMKKDLERLEFYKK